MKYNNEDYKVNKKGIFLPKYIPDEPSNKTNTIKSINENLELFIKITSVIAILSIVFGFFNIYKYLSYTNFIFILPNIIKDTSSLMSLIFFPAIFYISFFLICFSFFIFDVLIIEFIDDNDKKELISSINQKFFIQLFVLIYIICILLSYFFQL